MSAVAVVALMLAALAVGFQAGRRTSRTPTWRQRTRRSTLGRQALVLAVLMAAGHAERSVQRRWPAVGRVATPLGRVRRSVRLPGGLRPGR